jgi:hypothetical protein
MQILTSLETDFQWPFASQSPSFPTVRTFTQRMMEDLDRIGALSGRQDRRYCFPIDRIQIAGGDALLVNQTSLLVWQRGVPREALGRKSERAHWSRAHWAFIVASIERDPVKAARERLLYQGVSPFYHVLCVCTEIGQAVQQVIAHAACCVLSANPDGISLRN